MKHKLIFSLAVLLSCFAHSAHAQTILTIAGNGSGPPCSGDGGPAAAATLSTPYNLAIDPAGNLFIVDAYCSEVRVISTSGIITNFAGNGTWGYSGDGGPAIYGALNGPYDIALDHKGNLLIADVNNYAFMI